MNCQTIEAQQVRRGDYIWNSGKVVHPAFQWVMVNEVKTVDNKTYITTLGWYCVKHPREGITVRRLAC